MDHLKLMLTLPKNCEVVQTNLTATCDTEYWKCNATLISNKMSLHLNNLQVVRNATLSYKLFVRNMDERNSIFKNYLTKNIDICAFLKNPNSDTYLQVMFSLAWKGQNNKLFKKCPISSVSVLKHNFSFNIFII